MPTPLPPQTIAPNCFCCGRENPQGLQLSFELDERDETVATTFTPPEYWTGWGEVMHGGFCAMLLDETMAWTAAALIGDRSFVTKEITTRFHRPVYVGRPLTVTGRMERFEGREAELAAEIRDEQGGLLTEGRALFIKLPKEKLAALVRDSE